ELDGSHPGRSNLAQEPDSSGDYGQYRSGTNRSGWHPNPPVSPSAARAARRAETAGCISLPSFLLHNKKEGRPPGRNPGRSRPEQPTRVRQSDIVPPRSGDRGQRSYPEALEPLQQTLPAVFRLFLAVGRAIVGVEGVRGVRVHVDLAGRAGALEFVAH